MVHSACITINPSPVQSHNLGIWLAVSAGSLTISSTWAVIEALAPFPKGLRMTSTVSAVALGVSSISLPRRPDVFFENSPVDAQWTVSALNRVTWTWIQPLLRQASLQQDLDAGDIPHPDSKLRSQNQCKNDHVFKAEGSILGPLLTLYKPKLGILWLVTLLRCVISLLPFWFMFCILGILEDADTSAPPTQLLLLIACMAILNLVDSVRRETFL